MVFKTTGAVRRVLLIIGGGVAAYKSLEVIRRLAEREVTCRCVLTAGGAQFVTPLSVAALSGDKVYQDLFSLTDEAEMGHIELSRSADLILVAPATADLMAKAAQGRADDLASTALLATDTPVLMAPAMNVRMWSHPATQRNLAQLRADGVRFVGPNDGGMACGEYGPGRLAEPMEIVDAVLAQFANAPSDALAGRRIVLTAGPTREPIDPVRYLSNHSSGRQGFALATALAERGAEVTLIAGPVDLATPQGVTRVDVETAQNMFEAVEAALPADAYVGIAAVADWRPAEPAAQKLKLKGDGAAALSLRETPDILAHVARHPTQRPRLVVGFAAETHDVADYAQAKRARKGCDWIVANDVSGDVMGGADTALMLVTKAGAEIWPHEPKTSAAQRLADRIAEALNNATA
ncbi:MAG: bifunctional phosphopantothenoylcysteine decarboxylase/phosphopantothenate--cysteine ligase CoaBC [Maricaulaceae bacterium]